MVIRVRSKKVVACSKIKEITYKEKTSLYSDRIFITKSIIRAIYIVQLSMLQELSTFMTSYKPIERSASPFAIRDKPFARVRVTTKSVDQEGCAS